MAMASFLISLSKTLKPSPAKSPLLNHIANPSKTHLKLPLNLKPPPLTLLFNTNIAKPHKTPFKPQATQIKSLFTGIVEEMGEIKHLGFTKDDCFNMKIQAKTVLEDVHLGDSIAVNGTCLTVAEFDSKFSEFTVGLSPETLRKTSLI
ncbi:unnamed protein product [Ilex paraguariensis]|uniref:Lumazine-binding domain-containing protein n=1 Tax=Ilex paraguariensis TaxID=185542 RepID=A0ABC8RYJ2_9AQUA